MNPSVSNEEFEYLKKNKVRKILSFIPSDKPDCECAMLVREWGEKLGKMSVKARLEMQEKAEVFHCPKAKGMKRYEIICAKCGDKVAEVSALDSKLTDWCDLHCYSESRLEKTFEWEEVPYQLKGKLKTKRVKVYKSVGKWHGCRSIQISDKDGKLGIECACGQDTRDFRVKNNLTGRELKAKLKENMIGRNFGVKNSKYKCRLI